MFYLYLRDYIGYYYTDSECDASTCGLAFSCNESVWMVPGTVTN